MFSGGDSSGEGLNSLNHLNNFRLAALGSGADIDWASLAQQWIQMRDTGVAADINLMHTMPEAPPPPLISRNSHAHSIFSKEQTMKKTTFEEKGEADMDMDDEEDNVANAEQRSNVSDSPPPPAPSMQMGQPANPIHGQTQWFMQPQPPAQPIGGVLPAVEMGVPPTQWGVWPPRVTLPPPRSSSALPIPASNPTAHIPSLMKINIPNPHVSKHMSQHSSSDAVANATASVPMDAAKRKILPAWIREGLEKMEREKLKQLESQHDGTDMDSESSKIPAGVEKFDITNNKHSKDLTVNMKNTKTLESDSSGNEDDADADNDNDDGNIDGRDISSPVKIKPKDHLNLASNDQSDIDADDGSASTYRTPRKNFEETLADLMFVVRRTLTELLLEVTNEEISSIAQETINLRKSKASSAQVIRKSALSSITSKLGLAAYDDSSSNDDDSSASENDENTNVDSEEELKATIRAKRKNFIKISEEIEESIALSAEREEQKLKYYTQLEKQHQADHQDSVFGRHNRHDYERQRDSGRKAGTASSSSTSAVGKGYERDFGETTESKLQQSNGKRQRDRSSRKERTTRFSDNKDGKSSALAATATYISQIQSSSRSGAGAVAGDSHTSGVVNLFPMPSGGGVGGAIEVNDLCTVPSSDISKNLLNAADAVFEKATKSKFSTSTSTSKSRSSVRSEKHREERHRRRRRHSSDEDSSSSSDSDSSTSNSSRNSKYSRSSSSKHKKESRNKSSHDSRRYGQSSKYSHKHSSSSRKSTHNRDRDRDRSSRDYDDYYSSSRHSSRRTRTRSRSRSKSRSSHTSSTSHHRRY